MRWCVDVSDYCGTNGGIFYIDLEPQSTTIQQHSEVTNKGLPPSSHHAPNSVKPPLPPQRGSMVSYEDMIRNSPRNKAKIKNRSNSTVCLNLPISLS